MTSAKATRSTASRRPLAGARVVVTRSKDQAGKLSSELRRLGADVVEAPAIRLAVPRSWTRVDRVLREIDSFDWLVLTSANGVRFLIERLRALGRSPSVLRRMNVAAVGPGTAAALRSHGVDAALVPETFTTAAVGAAFPRGQGRVLLAQADRADPGLERAISARGWNTERVVLYRLVRAGPLDPGVRRMLRAGEIDVITFASGGTARAFAALLGRPLSPEVAVACIGPVTARAARDAGMRVDTVAGEHTIPGLAAAAADAWAARRAAR